MFKTFATISIPVSARQLNTNFRQYSDTDRCAYPYKFLIVYHAAVVKLAERLFRSSLRHACIYKIMHSPSFAQREFPAGKCMG